MNAKKFKHKNFGFFTTAVRSSLVLVLFLGVGSCSKNEADVKSLVEKLQTDIDDINKSGSEWQIQEAELEISLAVKNGKKGSAGNDKVSTAVSSEREQTNKLKLKIRKVQKPST